MGSPAFPPARARPPNAPGQPTSRSSSPTRARAKSYSCCAVPELHVPGRLAYIRSTLGDRLASRVALGDPARPGPGADVRACVCVWGGGSGRRGWTYQRRNRNRVTQQRAC